MANVSFFPKFANFPAILNILAYFRQTHPEMRVYPIFYVHKTHHKDSRKPYDINVPSRWHQAQFEAGIYIIQYLCYVSTII